MFVPLWLFFLGTGTLMAILTLVWAMRTNQFEDQDRARFLPLAALSNDELRAAPAAPRRAPRLAIYAVLLCGGLVLLGTAVVVLRHV